MIEKIEFKNLKKNEIFSYLTEQEFFKKNKSIEFKKGLNIIFSPNGTGKSSLLRMCAISLAAEQGGVSAPTNSWRMQLHSFNKKDTGTKMDGINVVHDGQPILYGNPRNAVGLIGGQFDDDFMMQGVQNSLSKYSTGYATMNRLNEIIHILSGEGKMPEKFDFKLPKTHLAPGMLKLLEPQIEKGQRTILLDEPESGLAMHVQANLFGMMHNAAKEKDLQIIVATHSPFCFTTIANFIELVPGHIETSKNALRLLQKFI